MKNRLIAKDPDAGKDRRWEEKGTTEDDMVGLVAETCFWPTVPPLRLDPWVGKTPGEGNGNSFH